MKQSQSNLKKVIHSIEMDYIRSELTAVFIVCAICLWLLSLSVEKEIGVIVVVSAVVVTAIYTLWRGIRICRKPDSYIFCTAVLYQPHRSDWRKAMYFTVVIEDAEGNRFPANTHAIFFTYSLTGLLLEDYVNKTVEVGYNMETGHVVVIG